MPSAFTHAFTGAAISLLAPREFRGPTLAVVLAGVAAMPDLDVVAFGFGIPYAHPLGHRGFSHSLTFACMVALVAAPVLAHRVATSLSHKLGLALVIALACASHGVLDALTDAGLGVGFFIPFNNARYFFPWRPVMTSPLQMRDFFAGSGLAILQNELLWIWLPTSCVIAAILLVRRNAPSGEPCR